MKPKRQINRRSLETRAFRLGQPLFIDVPRGIASLVLGAIALLVILVDQSTDLAISYAPLYLLLCAFGAWFVGSNYAILLGLFIATIQALNGNLIDHRVAPVAEAIDLAFRFGSVLAVILMLGVARAALEIEWRFARMDPLTGALNRKAFFEAIKAEAGRSGMSVLIFADLDGLKRLNDKVGHEKGDESLCAFASLVRKSIRKGDLFARVGGDEFVIYLNVQNLAAAKIVAARLNRVLNVEGAPSEDRLRCSLGILVLPEGSKNIDAELRQADSLMYQAKRERAGSAMALSVKGGKRDLLAIAPDDEPAAQRKAVRSTEREAIVTNGANGPREQAATA